MKAFTIGENDAGQRADRFVAKAMPELKAHQIQKGFRTKNIKIDGARAEPTDRLVEGQLLQVYVVAESGFTVPKGTPPYLAADAKDLDVAYEDAYIIIVWKPAAIACQPESQLGSRNDSTNGQTLEAMIQRYLFDKKEWRPSKENSFAPTLCHRLDRGTEGLVIAAKTAEAHRIVCEKIKNREIKKFYQCVVHGRPEPESGTLEDYLFKDARQNRVYVKPESVVGSKQAVLKYKTLKTSEKLTLVEVELVTGRTHQIRAQFSSRKWPLLGDGKYGDYALDKPYKRNSQALCAYKIQFAFATTAGVLDYLRGNIVTRHVKFEEMK